MPSSKAFYMFLLHFFFIINITLLATADLANYISKHSPRIQIKLILIYLIKRAF